jgi:regulator of sigma E protease
MLTVVAFVAALGLLVAIHEYGHYAMARACGVKVLKFSVGFGKTLASWTPKGSSTEFVLAAFPLGGFVKMLDEREAPVPDAERHLAFNNQPLRSRVAIVAAGPIANLLLAVLLYSLVNWNGVEQAKAVLASPTAGSVAERAGLLGGELVQGAGFADESMQEVASFEELRWLLTRGALEGRDVNLTLANVSGGGQKNVVLKLGSMDAREADAQLFRKIGIVGPLTQPVVGQVMAGGAALRAGLREGDVVQRVGSQAVVDGQQLREIIRKSVNGTTPQTSTWTINRGGSVLSIDVQPEAKQEGEIWVGRISAYIGASPDMVMVRYGLVDGLVNGAVRTWEVSLLTLKMMGKMVIGEVSLKNLSGPITIADFAGKSASMGLTQYLIFLALISVSLGVLNLLPLPVLDGGHLMYYLWEAVTGKTVSDAWMERLQRGGVAVLLMMMSIAFFNDISRLLG